MLNSATETKAIAYQSALRVAPLDQALEAVERAERLRSRDTYDGLATLNRKSYGAMVSLRCTVEDEMREPQAIAVESFCRYVSPLEIGLLLPPYLEPCEDVALHPILTSVKALKSEMELLLGLRSTQDTLWISGQIVRISSVRYGYLEVGVKCQRRCEEIPA